MNQLLYGRDTDVAAWVSFHAGGLNFGYCRAIGVMRKGALIAGVVYNEYRGNDMRLHFAAIDPRWASRRTISNLLAYPFLDVQCSRVTIIIRADNAKSLKFNRGIGFIEEGIIRQGDEDGTDFILMGMLKAEYLSGRYAPQTDILNVPVDQIHIDRNSENGKKSANAAQSA